MDTIFASLTTLEWIYLALFCSGLFYALFLAFFGLGHGTLDHGGIDHGGIDHGGIDHGGIDHGGGLDHGAVGHGGVGHGVDVSHGAGHGGLDHDAAHAAGHGGHGIDGQDTEPVPMRVSPWNPIVIATFISTLGAIGLMGTRAWHLGLLSLLPAIPAGAALAGGIYFLYSTLMAQAGTSSAATVQETHGVTAQVITPIPEKGLGEIVYEVRGMRYNAPARSISGQAIPRGSHVTVLQVKDSIAIVDLRYVD